GSGGRHGGSHPRGPGRAGPRAARLVIRMAIGTQPLRKSDAARRRVTILGATGSIGSSTVDLLKRQNGRFTVEALTAHKNAAALAKLARELGARFAAVGDHDAYGNL